MDLLARYDSSLFLTVNRLPHPDILVRLAFLLSGWQTFWLIWLCIGIVLFLREERRDHGFVLPFVLSGALSWFLGEFLMKHLTGRLRPPLVLGQVTVFGQLPGGYSFPSGHATLAFAMATVLAWKEPKWFIPLYALAGLVGLSRIYLGYHYPADVIGGAVLGWTIGWACIGLYAAIDRRFPFRRR